MVGGGVGGGERVGPQEVVNEKIYIFLRILAKQNMHKEDTRRICAGNTITDQLWSELQVQIGNKTWFKTVVG